MKIFKYWDVLSTLFWLSYFVLLGSVIHWMFF